MITFKIGAKQNNINKAWQLQNVYTLILRKQVNSKTYYNRISDEYLSK